jgi:hypothetical protein
MARRLLNEGGGKFKRLHHAALPEFRHVACPWRRLISAGCATVTDRIEILHGIDRPRPERRGRVRSHPVLRFFADIAPDPSALIAAQGQSGPTSSASASPSSALKDLFSQIDTNGDGKITKSEFEDALGAGGTNLAQADDVFNKLDANGDGTVSSDELSKALKGAGGHHGGHHHHAGGAGDAGSTDASGSSTDPLSQALAGSSSNSVTNSDGSTTTSITYADGSKVTLTTPAASIASSAATSSYNLVERLIQREAQALSSQATASLSIAA